MLFLSRNKLYSSLKLFAYMRHCSNTNINHDTLFDFKPKCSIEDEKKILDIINQSNSDQLSSLNISQSKIRNLQSYKNKKGPFKSLSEILEVDGLSVKILEKICEEVISDITDPSKSKKSVNVIKRHKQFVIPSLSNVNKINSSIGICLAPTGVSWAKLNHKDNKLVNWGYEHYGELPKKILLHEVFQLAQKILHSIPVSDAYVLEGVNGIGMQSQNQPALVSSYTQQLELTSMLLALINTSEDNTEKDEEEKPVVQNRVYFLKPKLPARLFKILVGNEKVSTSATVEKFIQSGDKFDLPCTQFKMDQRLINEYLAKKAPQREILGQALLLIVAFNDICLNKNPISLTAIMSRKR